MTTFLARPERTAALDALAYSSPEGPPGFDAPLFGGSLTAIPRGLASAVADVGMLATERFGSEGSDTFDARDYKVQADSTPARIQRYGRQAQQWLTPDPYTTGVIGQVLFGVSRVLPEAAAGFAIGGPVGGAAVPGVLQANAAKAAWEGRGVDPSTATLLGAIEGAGAGAGVLVPGFMGSLTGRAATAYVSNFLAQGGVNVAIGAGSRLAMRATLQADGRDALADQIHPFDAAEIATDFLLGGGFSILGARHALAQESAGRVALARGEALDDAMTVNSAGHLQVDTLPGAPRDIASLNAHADAMTRTTEALLRGEPPGVERLVEGARYDKPLNDEAFAREVAADVAAQAGPHVEPTPPKAPEVTQPAKDAAVPALKAKAEGADTTPYTDAAVAARDESLQSLSTRPEEARAAGQEAAVETAQRDAFTTTPEAPAERAYDPYPGTLSDPTPREVATAAADARVAEAAKSENAIYAAVNCMLSQGIE